MKNDEAKWYEKASGKKLHKTENVAKMAAKSAKAAEKDELKRQQEEKKLRTEPKTTKPIKSAKPENKVRKTKTPQKNTRRTAKTPFSETLPMFDTQKISEDSAKILENFGKIVMETRNLSSKQQVLLPKQIKNLSHQLTDDRNSRRLGYMNDAGQLSAYISYFMWWNLVRLTRLFASLPETAFKLNDGDFCLDLGSGPLTVPCALWLARPELRSKKLTFYALDLSQGALAAGEEIFLSIAAKTLKENQLPWKILRVKGALGTPVKQKPALITCANVFNEVTQSSEMPPDFLAKTCTADILKYFEKDSPSAQTVLLVEPGDPRSARLVSLMRDSFMRKGFAPLSPCPHLHACPMAGRTAANPNGKWCNFAFDTKDAPEELLKLSKNANLQKDRASLSYVLLCRQEEKTEGKNSSETEKRELKLRVASDFIRLPEIHKSAWYCCSELGLVLAIDKTNRQPKNGDLLTVKHPGSAENCPSDKKTGAVILDI
ncbi:small ribosomal subunit Rsm22 family protein [uncultured Treponema sp.]|uniref:small ribosomal subunit Rsm22 family protein n=1 Tax=uncultured Treponema sp. TaxID=162155 RepID=UPI00280B7087|nr:small ribosomal subunit Rsm22 family protein [uncultured Treponema sp.]